MMKESNKQKQFSKFSDLSEQSRSTIAAVINPLAADCFALYIKTKNFHWHLSGSHFRDYHLLFDEHADQLLDMVDVLAERVRKLGGKTLRSIAHIKQLQRIQDAEDSDFSALQMVRTLLHDNQTFITHMRQAHKVCSENNDVATTSILENYIDEGEKRIWFLYETQVDS